MLGRCGSFHTSVLHIGLHSLVSPRHSHGGSLMHSFMHVLRKRTHVHTLSLCERYGRRFILLLSIALQTVFGVAVAFAPNFVVYVILRFLVGTTISGVIINAFVLGTNKTQMCTQTQAWGDMRSLQYSPSIENLHKWVWNYFVVDLVAVCDSL